MKYSILFLGLLCAVTFPLYAQEWTPQDSLRLHRLLDFERFAVSDFDTGHFPSSGRRRGNPAILGVSGREVLSSCLITNFFFSEFVQRTGPFVGASH